MMQKTQAFVEHFSDIADQQIKTISILNENIAQIQGLEKPVRETESHTLHRVCKIIRESIQEVSKPLIGKDGKVIKLQPKKPIEVELVNQIAPVIDQDNKRQQYNMLVNASLK